MNKILAIFGVIVLALFSTPSLAQVDGCYTVDYFLGNLAGQRPSGWVLEHTITNNDGGYVLQVFDTNPSVDGNDEILTVGVFDLKGCWAGVEFTATRTQVLEYIDSLTSAEQPKATPSSYKV